MFHVANSILTPSNLDRNNVLWRQQFKLFRPNLFFCKRCRRTLICLQFAVLPWSGKQKLKVIQHRPDSGHAPDSQGLSVIFVIGLLPHINHKRKPWGDCKDQTGSVASSLKPMPTPVQRGA